MNEIIKGIKDYVGWIISNQFKLAIIESLREPVTYYDMGLPILNLYQSQIR